MHNFVFLGSSLYALQVLDQIIKIDKCIPFCVIDSNMNKEKIKRITKILPILRNSKFYDSSRLEDDNFIADLMLENLLLALSVNFSTILKPKFLSVFQNGVVNLHPSFLPFNRGHWPEVWAIINNTQAGVSLHYVDKGIDTGAIIKQIAIEVLPEDNGQTICKKTEDAGIKLIKSVWPKILYKKISATSQKIKYYLNKSSDLEKLAMIDFDKKYSAIELINILRALTMPEFIPGAYFIDKQSGDKIFINVYLSREKRPYSSI